MSRDFYNSINFDSDIILNENKEKNPNLNNHDINKYKNFKENHLPLLHQVRKKMNKKKENSLLEENYLGLYKSALSNNKDKKINENPDNNFKIMNHSINKKNLNNSYNYNFENRSPFANNWKKYFNIDEEFEYKEKVNFLKNRDLLKPRSLNKFKTISNYNTISNQNHNTHEHSKQIKTNNFQQNRHKNNFNNTVFYNEVKNTVEKKKIKNNFYFDKLNDKEYEEIYHKKNKSISNIEDNNSDISHSDLSAGLIFLIKNKMSENFLREENTEILNNEEQKKQDIINQNEEPIDSNNDHKLISFQKSNEIKNIELLIQRNQVESTDTNSNHKNEPETNKNRREISKDEIIKSRTNSKINSKQNEIFEENDDFYKILSKPVIIDNKIKDKSYKSFDFNKKKIDLIKEEDQTKKQIENLVLKNQNSMKIV